MEFGAPSGFADARSQAEGAAALLADASERPCSAIRWAQSACRWAATPRGSPVCGSLRAAASVGFSRELLRQQQADASTTSLVQASVSVQWQVPCKGLTPAFVLLTMAGRAAGARGGAERGAEWDDQSLCDCLLVLPTAAAGDDRRDALAPRAECSASSWEEAFAGDVHADCKARAQAARAALQGRGIDVPPLVAMVPSGAVSAGGLEVQLSLPLPARPLRTTSLLRDVLASAAGSSSDGPNPVVPLLGCMAAPSLLPEAAAIAPLSLLDEASSA